MAPPPDPAALLDLSPTRRAGLLTTAALEAGHVARLRMGAQPVLAGLDPAARRAMEHLLDEVARLSAQVDALTQAQEAARLSREERIRLDPLRHIPEDRLAAALAPAAEVDAAPFTLDAGAPGFTGTGWHAAEPIQGGTLRWSGAGRCATLLLPALGGGRLRLTLSLRAPYGQGFAAAAAEWFLDGIPVPLRQMEGGPHRGSFEGEVEIPETGPAARIVLLLHGEQWEDPAQGPRRDLRRLGLGLVWLRLERADG